MTPALGQARTIRAEAAVAGHDEHRGELQLAYDGVIVAAGCRRRRRWQVAASTAITSLFLVGCGSGTQPGSYSAGMGSIHAAVTLMAQSGGPSITRVQIEVEPAGVFGTLALDSTTGFYTGVLVVPTGAQTITATAYSGTTLVGTGTANTIVARNGTTTVLIKVLDNSTAPAPQQHGPIITSVSAPADAATGETISLAVTAIDVDQDPITYSWTEDCGGVFGTPAASTTTWSDATAESCVLTATVTANGLSDTMRIPMSVVQVSADVGTSVQFVPVPYVTNVALDGSGLSCSIARTATDASCRPAIAPSTVLAVTVTYDPMPADSGATIELLDDCNGSSAPTALDLAGGTASFTWTAPASTASCLLTARASRDGLTDAEQVAVAVSG